MSESDWRMGARQAFAQIGVTDIRPYSTRDFGRERYEGALSSILPEEEAKAELPELRKHLPTGTVAFVGTTRWLGDEQHTGAELVIGPGETQWDILRIANSDACNYGLDAEDLIAKLQTYDALTGISIFHAETDIIEFTILRNPPDMQAFAEDIYKFCPDTVDQGVGSVEALAERIDILGEVYLWWD